MNKIVKIEFYNLIKNCVNMGTQYCEDSHCEVEPYCKLSGIERKVCDPDICPLICKESEVEE